MLKCMIIVVLIVCYHRLQASIVKEALLAHVHHSRSLLLQPR